MYLGVGRDDEVGNEELPRTASLAVAFESEPSKVGGHRRDGFIADGEASEEIEQLCLVGCRRGEFRENDWTDDDRALGGSFHERIQPGFVAGFMLDDGP